MQLEIYTPERKVFRGQVYGIQLPGIDGFFEVLENHAPMVAALKPGKMKVLNDKTNFSFYNIKGGFIEVLSNHATVLVEGAVPTTGK
jgi:F-type H+-transporting ATPase subunit epsilon